MYIGKHPAIRINTSIQIGNYLAFYIVDDEAERVIVVRFLHMKRDWIRILRSG